MSIEYLLESIQMEENLKIVSKLKKWDFLLLLLLSHCQQV